MVGRNQRVTWRVTKNLRGFWVPHPFGLCRSVRSLSFPSTPFIRLDLSLLLTNISHLWYPFVCYLEQTSLGALPRSLALPLSPLLPSGYALLISLCALFPTPILCFQ